MTRYEPRWLTEDRDRAWKVYADTPLPSHKNEDWKYTDLSALPLDEHVGDRRDTHTARGTMVIQRSRQNGWGRQGVVFEDILEGAEKYPETLRQYLHSLIPSSQWKLSALHAAMFNGGSLLSVPAEITIPVPLRSVYVAQNSPPLFFPHTVIVLSPGSSATYIEEYLGEGDGAAAYNGLRLSVAHVEIVLEEGAHLTYFNIQHHRSDVTHIMTQAARLGRGSQLTTVSVSLGGKVIRNDVRTFLTGGGSRSEILGIVLGDGGQKFDIQTLQDHSAPDTFSDLLFKSVLKDTSRSAYTGLIHIGKKAQKSNAYQANRNLLMNRGAKSFSTPKLEIEADDVRCTHGATVGSFDEEQLFYLTSRGINMEDAEKMIVEGFFEPIVNRLPDWGLRERLWTSLRKKIGSARLEGE